MAEQNLGTKLTDENIIKPSLDDFYYNSLYVVDQINIVDVKEFYYIEKPPGGTDAVGFSTGDYTGSIFTIKVSPKNLLNNDLSILTGKVDGQSISFNAANCSVKSQSAGVVATPSNPNGLLYDNRYNTMSDLRTNDEAFFGQLLGTNNVKEYLVKNIGCAEKENVSEYLSSNYTQLLNTTLMFCNSPRLPYYSVELIKNSDVTTSSFQEMVSKNAGDTITISPTKPEFMIDSNGLASTKYQKHTGKYCEEYKNDDTVTYTLLL